MPYVETKIEVAGKPEAVYALASDMESYPKFMKSVDRITVLERGEGWTVTKWEARLKGHPFIWTEKDTFDPEKLRIEYNILKGDLKKWEGAWTFDPTPSGTLVTLTVDLELGLPMFASLLNPIAAIVTRQNCESMLEGMKKHFEEQ